MARALPSPLERLWRRIRKIFEYRPPQNLIAIILMLLSIFLISGGIYDISMPTRGAIPYGSGFLFLYPSLHDQLLSESIAVMVIYALGAAGLILIYQSVKYRRNPSQASMLIQVGIALLIIAIIILEVALYSWKLGFGF
ncbi:hypothetical protein KEJ29_02090 [Candidatus Bathyarchaeota archaeon]|nr:hypothetical protein [Candidatus Bathyarchaeota archaeon]